MDPRVLDAMMPMYMQRFGNPHSRTRKFKQHNLHITLKITNTYTIQ